MAQLNVNLTPEFERAMERLMRLRGIATKSEAVRVAVQEAAEQAERDSEQYDFSRLIGLATRSPVNPRPRFRSDDELWAG